MYQSFCSLVCLFMLEKHSISLLVFWTWVFLRQIRLKMQIFPCPHVPLILYTVLCRYLVFYCSEGWCLITGMWPQMIYKGILQVFNMSCKNIDADQRLTQDLEKLTTDLSSLVTGMVKPTVDILWWVHAYWFLLY